MVGYREQGDSEEEQEAKLKTSPPKGKAGDHRKEVGAGKRRTESKRVKEEEEVEDKEDAEDEDSDDGGELMIADDETQDDEEKESDIDSDESDDEDESQQFMGTMTRRQSKQLKEAGDGGGGSAKKKNRTCDYCGVVKATPAALVRHIRKHTGERPFVCKLCGKAYKAKRSLNLHENTQHNNLSKNPIPSLVPQEIATTLAVAEHIHKQTSSTPPISESTKSLLRETLESSRKAKDGSVIAATATGPSGSQSVESALATSPACGASERLSTPNLVNLLTSDISARMEQSTPPQGIAPTVSKPSVFASANYVQCQNGSKVEAADGVLKVEQEEQAEDLSIHARKGRDKEESTSSAGELKCEFCPETFKHEKARVGHTQAAHGIIVNSHHSQDLVETHGNPSKAHHTTKPKQSTVIISSPHSSFTKIEPKVSTGTLNLLQTPKHHVLNVSEVKLTDLPIVQVPFSSILTKKLRESHHSASPSSPAFTESVKAEVATFTLPSIPSADLPPGQDETNALPYYITSRMIQDFNAEELAASELEKSVVLAEDGGHRKCRMTVTKETVLATRLDGINNITGRQATVYKCQLCKRVFSSMMRYNNHIPSHYDCEITTYDCRYCDASFRSHIQIIKHLQCHREKFVGLNQAYSDDAHQQKKKAEGQNPDANSNNNVINLNSSLSPSSTKNSNSPSPQPMLEPGEKINGGYPCGKCRKSFTREYLLQRHMRIHQNQSSFYCPDCESGFTGELDLLEHRRRFHGFHGSKAAEEQHKYQSLLTSVPVKANQSSHHHHHHHHHHHKPSKTANSDSNNNTNLAASGALPASSSSLAASGQEAGRTGLYPTVDMKAIDLRHGEEVAVRMVEGAEDKGKEELLKKTLSEEYNTRMMMKVRTEMATFLTLLAEKQQANKDSGKDWQTAIRRQMLINAMNEEELKKRTAEKAASEEEARRAVKKKLQEEQQARQKREDEKRRKMEQAQLKEKLAKEGMGDVTVVLPVAPSPDMANKDRVNSEEVQGTDKTIKAHNGQGHQNNSHPTATSRIDEVLEKEYGQGPSTENANSEPQSVDKSESGTERSSESNTSATASLRRHLSGSEATGAPPAKSRRKALKPQKINHFTTENVSSKKVDALQASGANGSSDGAGAGGKEEDPDKTSKSLRVNSDRAKDQTGKETAPQAQAFSTINGLHHLLAIRNSGTVSASDLTVGKGVISLASPATPLNSQYYNKIIAGYDVNGKPIMYNSNAANSGDEGEGVVMDLSKERAKKKTAPLSNDNKSSSPPSSSSSSPVTMSCDGDSLAKLAGTGLQLKGHRLKALSRSISLDHASLEQDSSASQEYVSYSSPEAASKSDEQLSFKLALTQSQFSKALLTGPGAAGSDNASLIGLPRLFWGSSAGTGGKAAKSLSGKTNGVSHNKSRTSSPSPVPSPTNSDTSSADGRKITSLSRTHSRLSVVNEPVDRNTLCKPKVIENGKAVYSCAICSKNFLSLSDINRHMDFHEDIRPYKCKYCDYYARTNSQLKVHKLRHEGVREFCCRVCNYRGVTQSDLNRHMKSQVHLLRSNHICDHCGEGFVTPKTLLDHVANACTGTRMDCFDKSFEHATGKELEEGEDGVGGEVEEGVSKEDVEMDEEDEDEVMDLRIVGVDDMSNDKEVVMA